LHRFLLGGLAAFDAVFVIHLDVVAVEGAAFDELAQHLLDQQFFGRDALLVAGQDVVIGNALRSALCGYGERPVPRITEFAFFGFLICYPALCAL
jgi:hypothetical protein